jgi:hypothetical protein
MKKIKDNKRQFNHAYQYNYTHKKNRNRHNRHENRDKFNHNWSNKIYFRCPDDWFYELKGQHVSQSRAQNNGSRRDIT